MRTVLAFAAAFAVWAVLPYLWADDDPAPPEPPTTHGNPAGVPHGHNTGIAGGNVTTGNIIMWNGVSGGGGGATSGSVGCYTVSADGRWSASTATGSTCTTGAGGSGAIVIRPQ